MKTKLNAAIRLRAAMTDLQRKDYTVNPLKSIFGTKCNLSFHTVAGGAGVGTFTVLDRKTNITDEEHRSLVKHGFKISDEVITNSGLQFHYTHEAPK